MLPQNQSSTLVTVFITPPYYIIQPLCIAPVYTHLTSLSMVIYYVDSQVSNTTENLLHPPTCPLFFVGHSDFVHIS